MKDVLKGGSRPSSFEPHLGEDWNHRHVLGELGNEADVQLLHAVRGYEIDADVDARVLQLVHWANPSCVLHT